MLFITLVKYVINNNPTREEAFNCKSKPITQDKGIKLGDKVRILNGNGAGGLGLVKRLVVIDKKWGQRYWHTIMLIVDIVGSFGSRQLVFDDYEKV